MTAIRPLTTRCSAVRRHGTGELTATVRGRIFPTEALRLHHRSPPQPVRSAGGARQNGHSRHNSPSSRRREKADRSRRGGGHAAKMALISELTARWRRWRLGGGVGGSACLPRHRRAAARVWYAISAGGRLHTPLCGHVKIRRRNATVRGPYYGRVRASTGAAPDLCPSKWAGRFGKTGRREHTCCGADGVR